MRKPNFWRTWQRGVDPAEVHQEKVHRHMGHRRPTMATWVPASPEMPATGVRLRGNRAFIWVCRTYGRLEVVGSGDG